MLSISFGKHYGDANSEWSVSMSSYEFAGLGSILAQGSRHPSVHPPSQAGQ